MELLQALWQCLSGTASTPIAHTLVMLFLVFGILALIYAFAAWLDKKSRREPPDNSVEEQGWFHVPEPRDEEGTWPPPPKSRL